MCVDCSLLTTTGERENINYIQDHIRYGVYERTKQVINDRQIERANVIHEEEDYESLDSVHEIENSDYVEKDKVIVTSLNEYLNNEIEVIEEQSQDI